MLNYDFLNLSPFEFEVLTRDLLQHQLGIFLETFGHGQDQGIDLRYAQGTGMIVQCKRYTSFGELYQNLKAELEKVKKLAPDRYVFSTSVSLNPVRKQKIFDLLKPYVKDLGDIYGREDLNNLLTLFPKVESDNFKLWLTGTNVLKNIFNRQIINSSKFALDEILHKIKIYVQNQSFTEARQILSRNNYVVISGIPGIGKTTLAEVLIYHALAEGVEQFVYVSESIGEAFKSYDEEKSQIFLFDDFLGSNFLQNTIQTNEEKQIIKFIERIENSKNKLLVFTTREYILNQAKIKYELFENKDFSKTVLDLSKYTTMVRAEILYNHLYFNNIPYAYIEKVIEKKCLMKIVQHANYNPRIIEYLSNVRLWQKFTPEDFPDEMLKIFDSPDSVWEHAFENQISDISKYILFSMLIVGGYISTDNLYGQVRSLINLSSPQLLLNIGVFKKGLKELDNSFLQFAKNYDGVNVKFHNPSIRDFLYGYLQKNKLMQKDLISSALYLAPLVSLFSDKESFGDKPLKVHADIHIYLENKVITDFYSMGYRQQMPKYGATSDQDVIFMKLNSYSLNIKVPPSGTMYKFIKETVRPFLYSTDINNNGVNDFASILTDYFCDEQDVNIPQIMTNIADLIESEDDLAVIANIEAAFPKQFDKFRENDIDLYYSMFSQVISQLSSIETDELEILEAKISQLTDLENSFEVDTYDERARIEDYITKLKYQDEMQRIESGYYQDEYDKPYPMHPFDYKEYRERNFVSSGQRRSSEEDDIENLFRSLNQ